MEPSGTVTLDALYSFELSLATSRRGTPPAVNDLADEDVGTAAEFLALRWLWMRDHRQDLLEFIPELAQWEALRILRSLMQGCGNLPPSSQQRPQRQASQAGRVGVHELAPVGTAAWEPGGSFLRFQQRFQVALREAGNDRRFSYMLAAAFQEMASNAVEHAGAPIPPIACFEVTDSEWRFTVTDVGRGVLSSIRDNPAYSATRTEKEALKLVVQDDVSRTGERGRGRGFTQMFKALVDRRAVLRFRSRGTTARWDGESPTAQKIRVEALPTSRDGFHVRAVGPLSRR